VPAGPATPPSDEVEPPPEQSREGSKEGDQDDSGEPTTTNTNTTTATPTATATPDPHSDPTAAATPTADAGVIPTTATATAVATTAAAAGGTKSAGPKRSHKKGGSKIFGAAAATEAEVEDIKEPLGHYGFQSGERHTGGVMDNMQSHVIHHMVCWYSPRHPPYLEFETLVP
jgi:hypothetical protein